MEILKNSLIVHQFDKLNYFDLGGNNERLKVILIAEEHDSKKQLQNIFADILANKKINYGYYQLKNIFTNSQSYDTEIIVNLIVKTIQDKVNIIASMLAEETVKIDVAKYVQIWQEYVMFGQQLYYLLINHQKFLTEKNIKTSNISTNILSVLQLCIFYDNIFSDSSLNIIEDLTEYFDNELNSVGEVEQLINFIDSMKIFLMVQNFTKINKVRIMEFIRKIMSNTYRVNQLCHYMHDLLLKLNNKMPIVNNYQTVSVVDMEKPIISKIYKIASILSVYAEKEKLLICYSKFMQIRMLNLKYDNSEIEIEIIKRISGAIEKDESQKLLDAISDILQSKNIIDKLHSSTIKNVSGKYDESQFVDLSAINPIILVEKNWKIQNTMPLNTTILFPPEIKYCLDIASKFFSKLNISSSPDWNYIISWQPLLGVAEFEAEFKLKKVLITCNILQAILLSYINNDFPTTIDKFSQDTNITYILGEKIFESLSDAGIIILNTEGTYIPNFNNYVGESKIDLRPLFLETFNPNKSEIVPKNKFSYITGNSNKLGTDNNFREQEQELDDNFDKLEESDNDFDSPLEISINKLSLDTESDDDIPVIKSYKQNVHHNKSESESESESKSESASESESESASESESESDNKVKYIHKSQKRLKYNPKFGSKLRPKSRGKFSLNPV